MYGDSLQDKYLSSKTKTSLLISDLQMMPRQYAVQQACYMWLQAAIRIADDATLS